MTETFSTSIAEMNRRKTAYLSLSVGIFAGAGFSSFVIFTASPSMVIAGLTVFAAALVAGIVSCNTFLENSKRISVTVSDMFLERYFNNGGERYSLGAVKRIRIKRTVKHTIREIKINLSGARAVYINGLDGFEQFKSVLLGSLRGEVPITEFREPIDFDHPLFYPIFGTITGFLSVFALKVASQMTAREYHFLQIGIACFTVVVGIGWLIAKPISGHYGEKAAVADYVSGASMVAAGIGVALISKVL